MGRERVLEIPGLSDLADLAYINLDKRSWRTQPNSPGVVGNKNHFPQSETPRLDESNVIFSMNGTLKYYEHI